VLSNKYQGKLGYFLIKFNACILHGGEKPKYLMKWKNKLEFGDASITVLNNYHTDYNNWLIVSYKTIYINIYNVLIFEEETGKIKYSHKNY
jgi:hypothetical protein